MTMIQSLKERSNSRIKEMDRLIIHPIFLYNAIDNFIDFRAHNHF